MKPSIAVIIVTYNGSRWIRRCLASVFSSDYPPSYPPLTKGGIRGGVDVIVVDNASDDATTDIVKQEFPEADLIRLSKNMGFAGGNNIGITEALRRGYECVFLLNQDTEIEPGAIGELVRVAEAENAGIVQGMLLLGTERNLTNNIGNALHYLGFGFVKHYRESAQRWTGKEPLEIGYASGAAMLIKREVLEELSPPARGGDTGGEGVFDESFFSYHEDLDLCWRAKLAGCKVVLAPQAIVYHYYEFNRNKKMFYWTERNRWAALLKNYSVTTLILLAPMLAAVEVMMLAYSALGGWLGYKLKSYAWIVCHVPLIFVQRRRVQSMRRVPDRIVFAAMDAELVFSEIRNPLLVHVISPLAVLYYHVVRLLV